MKMLKPSVYIISVWTVMCVLLSGCNLEAPKTDPSHPIDPVSSHRVFKGQATLGALVGSHVELYPLSGLDKSATYSTVTDNSADLDNAGEFSIPESALTKGEAYLLKVYGGYDIDADDNGVIDDVVTRNSGTFHAVLTTEQIEHGDYHVSIVTEAIYQRLGYMLAAGYSNKSILSEVDFRAAVVIKSDLNGDGVVDGSDVVRWHPRFHRLDLRKPFSGFQALVNDVYRNNVSHDLARKLADDALGHIDLPFVGGIKVVGESMYVAGDRGLQIVDLSDLGSPKVFGSLETSYKPNSVHLDGTVAFIGDWLGGGVYVIDVHDPRQPTLLSRVDVPFQSRVEAVQNGYVYVITSQGLQIVDVRDPVHPSKIPLIPFSDGARSFVLAGDLGYVGAGPSWSSSRADGITLLDLKDPSHPVVVGQRLKNYWSGTLIAATDKILYSLDSVSLGITMSDISDPQNPVWGVSSLYLADNFEGLKVAGDTVYVLGGGLEVVDVRDPAHPVQWSYIRGSRYTSIDVSNGVAYFASASGSIRFRHLRGQQYPAIAGAISELANVRAVEVAQSTAFVVDGDKGLRLYDVAKSGQPVVDGRLDGLIGASKISVVGSSVFVDEVINCPSGFMCQPYTYPGVELVDLSNSGALTKTTVSTELFGAAYAGKTAYTLRFSPEFGAQLNIFSIEDPTLPVKAGTLNIAGFPGVYFSDVLGQPTQIVISGSAAYAIVREYGRATVVKIDISAPLAPVVLGTLNIDGFGAFRIDGSRAYVTDDQMHSASVLESGEFSPMLILSC